MSSKTKKVIHVKDLVVSLGNKVVLDKLSFDVHEGELTAILGPNGSGKSTLIKAIMGLIPKTSGTVEIYGKDPSKSLQQIGYLPQNFQFERDFPITVAEFLELSLQKGKPAMKIDEKLEEVGMISAKNQLLGTLSGGQLQRVMIARAILNDPKLLILDEPEAGIDVEAERGFYKLIKHLDERHGITIIFISHEVDLVYDFAEQVICLNKALVCRGVPRKVLTPEKLEELYGAGLMHHQHVHHEPHENINHPVEEHSKGKHEHKNHRHT